MSVKPKKDALVPRKAGGGACPDRSFLDPTAPGLEESLEELKAYIYVQPTPMWGNAFRNNEKIKQTMDLNLSVMFRTLLDEKKSDKVIDKILSEVILGAYQDRSVAYSISPSGLSADNTEALERVQRIRHRADRHLLQVLETFKEIKRPPVKVVVKQAEQVNIAERQMNVDKQLNISSDLDKK
jgi:hypothetical protein